MKRWALRAVSLLLALPLCAADWKESLTAPVPGAFAPLRPVRMNYRFGWNVVHAATASFDFSKLPGEHRRLTMHARTTGAVRALWQMDCEHHALCDAATLQPDSLEQREVYQSETESAKVSFARDSVERLMESSPAGKNPAKKKRFALPNAFDLQTAFLFVRSQPLKPADAYRLIVFPARSAYLADVSVAGRERLAVGGQEYESIKCQVRLQKISKQGELKPHSKFKRAFVWLSDDADRLLLKIQADVFVRSVWAELESVQWTE